MTNTTRLEQEGNAITTKLEQERNAMATELELVFHMTDLRLLEDKVVAIYDVRALCGGECFDVLSLPRRSVIINMALHLKKYLTALAEHDYDTAAVEMIKAKWLRRLIELMQQESDISLT